MQKLWHLLLYFLLVLVACNTALNRRYNAITYEEDLQEIRKTNKVSDEDLKAMVAFILLSKLSGNDLTGKSYNDILEKIKIVRQSNSELNDREALEKDAKRQRMSAFIMVNLQTKEFVTINSKQLLKYVVTLKNLSSQKIKMITGHITISDLIEKPIKKINILVDEDIPAGQALTKTFTSEYNPGDENDRRIRTKDLVDMRVIWDPEKIIFENGKMAE